VSTTVDEDLLSSARHLRAELTDAALLDEALTALLALHRSAEIDVAYAAYDEPRSASRTNGAILRHFAPSRTLHDSLPARGEGWWCEMRMIQLCAVPSHREEGKRRCK